MTETTGGTSHVDRARIGHRHPGRVLYLDRYSPAPGLVPLFTPDGPTTTWVEPCACPDGQHRTWAERDAEGFTAHLATIYRYDRKAGRK